MKKTTFFAMLLAGACIFTACKKEGVYNPKEKIAAIYSSSEISYTSDGRTFNYSQPKHLDEKWNWDGKTLTSIEFYGYTYDGLSSTESSELDYILDFTYDGKRLSKINLRGDISCYVEFIYDGKLLTTVNTYTDNELEECITITHDGKKISKITITGKNGYHPYADQKKFNLMNKLVLRSVLNDIDAAEKVQQMAKRSAEKGSKENNTGTYLLTWDGDNISKLEKDDANGYITFTYDNKKNPLYGFSSLLVLDSQAPTFNYDFCNSNNVTSMTLTIPAGNDTYSETENYTYTYDGKWPITRTIANSYSQDNNSYSLSNTTYFEYDD